MKHDNALVISLEITHDDVMKVIERNKEMLEDEISNACERAYNQMGDRIKGLDWFAGNNLSSSISAYSSVGRAPD